MNMLLSDLIKRPLLWIIKLNSDLSGKMKNYFVYIMSSRTQGVLYTGITGELIKRVYQHKSGIFPGFTKKYKINLLVWYEIHNDVYLAIKREKQIKKWKREWKIKLIEEVNPDWKDLYGTLM